MRFFSMFIIVAYSLTISASPCNDSLLNALSSKDSSTYTSVESFYVQTKKNECRSYTDSLQKSKIDSVAQIEKEEKWAERKSLIIAGIVIGVIAEVIIIAVFLSSKPSGVKMSVMGQEI